MRFKFDEMSPQDFMRYAASHPWIDEVPERYANHPVCPQCEQIALRDKGWSEEKWAHCPNCHRTFKSTMSLKEYMKEQLYRR
ncbi:hypothetical protein [Paenibacillus anseongense]|uniref:hypothetical protein n=1 Tax=Paenibacillus anseongense TaxID=2682845 RepID=UPI002DB8F8B1|nr:hypothetical protein [Paenibacillus anseongense]MEC0265143.1 hypothetical protein [Paenibacillus anseongense]